jgi:hypothetical protein
MQADRVMRGLLARRNVNATSNAEKIADLQIFQKHCVSVRQKSHCSPIFRPFAPYFCPLSA